MARIKRGVTSHAKHKKVLKAVKGQWGRRKNTIRVAKQAMEKALQYAYRDRRSKKREFRSLWIQRINAGVRAEGITYSKFINGLNKSGIKLDRKVLADIAFNNPEVFKSIVKKVQSSLSQQGKI
jgi:large subunit ribosomal protein L20